jgi:ankyrin repeat protein
MELIMVSQISPEYDDELTPEKLIPILTEATQNPESILILKENQTHKISLLSFIPDKTQSKVPVGAQRATLEDICKISQNVLDKHYSLAALAKKGNKTNQYSWVKTIHDMIKLVDDIYGKMFLEYEKYKVVLGNYEKQSWFQKLKSSKPEPVPLVESLDTDLFKRNWTHEIEKAHENLFRAITEGDLAKAKQMMELGIDANQNDKFTELSAVQLAVSGRSSQATEILHLLRQKDAVLSKVDQEGNNLVIDKDGNNLLHLAIKGGNPEVVSYLMVRLAFPDGYGSNPKIKSLLEERNHQGETPLMVALKDPDSGLSTILLDVMKGDPRIRNLIGETILWAVENKIKKALPLLLPYVDAQQRNRALDRAVDIGSETLVDVLLMGKVTLDKTRAKELSIRAAKNIREGSHHIDLAKKFLTYVDKGEIKETANQILQIAAEKGSIKLYRFLVDVYKANILSEIDKETIFIRAAKNGQLEFIKFLLSHGAVKAALDSVGQSFPTIEMAKAAAQNGKMNVLKYFIEDRSGDKLFQFSSLTRQSFLTVAIREKQVEIVRYLMNKLTLSDMDKRIAYLMTHSDTSVDFQIKQIIWNSTRFKDEYIRNREGPPLLLAMAKGKPFVDAVLLENPDLNESWKTGHLDENSNSILTEAIERKNLEIVQSWTSQKDVPVGWVETAYQKVIESGNYNVKDFEIMQILWDLIPNPPQALLGAVKPGTRDSFIAQNKGPPIRLAIDSGNRDFVRAVIQHSTEEDAKLEQWVHKGKKWTAEEYAFHVESVRHLKDPFFSI